MHTLSRSVFSKPLCNLVKQNKQVADLLARNKSTSSLLSMKQQTPMRYQIRNKS